MCGTEPNRVGHAVTKALGFLPFETHNIRRISRARIDRLKKEDRRLHFGMSPFGSVFPSGSFGERISTASDTTKFKV
jgi:hypothetical protein